MNRVEKMQQDLNECDEYDDDMNSKFSCFRCQCCEEVWSSDIKIMIAGKEICENCIDIYNRIYQLKQKVLKINDIKFQTFEIQ